jgi:hypothetical protein
MPQLDLFSYPTQAVCLFIWFYSCLYLFTYLLIFFNFSLEAAKRYITEFIFVKFNITGDTIPIRIEIWNQSSQLVGAKISQTVID